MGCEFNSRWFRSRVNKNVVNDYVSNSKVDVRNFDTYIVILSCLRTSQFTFEDAFLPNLVHGNAGVKGRRTC